MIQALSVEGSRLDTEPSAISAPTVDGSTPDTRTVHDSDPKRGRSSFGHRTIHDINLQRGRFNTRYPNCPRYGALTWKVQLWTSNRPRYRPIAWRVQPLNPEPSAISAPTVDGSTPDTRTVHDSGPKRGRFGLGKWNHPRNRPPAWMVQHLIPEPSAISAPTAEGSRLDTEPSAISTSSVEGSTHGPRTVHDSGPNRGRFNP